MFFSMETFPKSVKDEMKPYPLLIKNVILYLLNSNYFDLVTDTFNLLSSYFYKGSTNKKDILDNFLRLDSLEILKFRMIDKFAVILSLYIPIVFS